MSFIIDRLGITQKKSAVSEELLNEVEKYIRAYYEEINHEFLGTPRYFAKPSYIEKIPAHAVTRKQKLTKGLDEMIGDLDEPFNVTLLRLIDAKGKNDVEVYKRANIDRKLFSKIRSGKKYLPSKRTALALAIALELSLEETDDLLGRAGYTLSHSQKMDVIVEYFIINGRYDLFEINEVLLKYDQPLLGAS